MPTIIPLTEEAIWLEQLRDVPLWEPPLVPTVVLAPHPDDETLGAGGLLVRLRAAGVPVHVLALTDGEGAYADTEGLDRVRVPEQDEALRRLGIAPDAVTRLRLPDRALAAHEAELAASVHKHLQPGVHVIAPWPGDFHPDHEAAGRAAAHAARAAGAQLTFYLFWTWHRGTPAVLDGQRLLRLPLSGDERQQKLHALAAHASQMSHPDGQPILSERLLAPARRPFEVYLSL